VDVEVEFSVEVLRNAGGSPASCVLPLLRRISLQKLIDFFSGLFSELARPPISLPVM
jgi:hypothetical protein